MLAYIDFTSVFGLKLHYRISSACKLGFVWRTEPSNDCAGKVSFSDYRTLTPIDGVPFMVLPAPPELLQECCQQMFTPSFSRRYSRHDGRRRSWRAPNTQMPCSTECRVKQRREQNKQYVSRSMLGLRVVEDDVDVACCRRSMTRRENDQS